MPDKLKNEYSIIKGHTVGFAKQKHAWKVFRTKLQFTTRVVVSNLVMNSFKKILLSENIAQKILFLGR